MKTASSATTQATPTPIPNVFAEAIASHDFGAGYTVEVGALCEVQGGYGPGNTVYRIVKDWTLPTGSGTYTWSEAYRSATISPKYQVNFSARGAVETTIDTSVSGSITLQNKLTGAGFTITGTVGTKVYLRKVESWSGSTVF